MEDFLHKYGVWIFWGGVGIFVLWTLFAPGGRLSDYAIDDYVFACPTDRSDTKCYKLLADIQDGECEADYDYRGGNTYCEDPTVSTIYFPSGGYIDFDYCDYEGNKWNCYSSNTDETENWEITFAERVKRPKSEQ